MSIETITLIFTYVHSSLGLFIYNFLNAIGIGCYKQVIYDKVQWSKFSRYQEHKNKLRLYVTDELINDIDIIDKERYTIGYKDNSLNKIIEVLKKLINCDAVDLKYLINIFSKYNLNEYLIGYRELYWNQNETLRFRLIDRFKTVFNELDRHKESRYIAYLKINLKYMILNLETGIYSRNIEKEKELLGDCGELLKRYKDWYKLYELTGDICKISTYDKLFTDTYYDKVIAYCNDSVEISLIELKLLRETKRFTSSIDYRVYFKITFDMEPKRTDVDSINLYNNILSILYNQKEFGCTDLSEAKILIKVLTRIKCKLGNLGMETSRCNITNEINNIYSNLGCSKIFKELIDELDLTQEEFVNNIRVGLNRTLEMRLGMEIN